MVFLFFHVSHFFKNYTDAVFHFFVVFFASKKSVFNAKNENAENAQNAENSNQNFDCYGVIQELRVQFVASQCHPPGIRPFRRGSF